MPDQVGSELLACCQLAVGIVFLTTSISKVRDPKRFIRDVRRYEVLPTRSAAVVAALLVAGEIGVAFALVTGLGVGIGAPLAVALTATFFSAVAVNLRRRHIVPCGCFGDETEVVSELTLARLGLLLAVSVGIVIGDAAELYQPDIWRASLAAPGGVAQAAETAMAAVLFASAFIWMSRLRELASILAGLRAPVAPAPMSKGRSSR